MVNKLTIKEVVMNETNTMPNQEHINLPMKCLESRSIYEDPWLRLFQDDVIQTNGKIHTRNVIRTKSGAGAVAITDSEEVCLILQYRYPINTYSLEIPKGAFNSFESVETPLSVAKRELQEETGILARSWHKLSMIHTMTGYSDDGVHLFLATNLDHGVSMPDETEIIQPLFIPLQKIRDIVANGMILSGKRVIMTDATSIAAIFLAELAYQKL
jgi:ADP-ribose pyrophosphatase